MADRIRNPFQLLIDQSTPTSGSGSAVEGDTARNIHKAYQKHRDDRNASQRERLLSPRLSSLDLDPVLERLVEDKDYEDTRHCLVFWSRPPNEIRLLVQSIQEMLLQYAPNLWLMPVDYLHMTTFEIAHSMTHSGMSTRIEQLKPFLDHVLKASEECPNTLVSPMLNYDAGAIALSFLPAADHPLTYHHLRRDLFDRCVEGGVEIASRYCLPSAHMTIARFTTNFDMTSPGSESIASELMQKWVAELDRINEWLKTTWPRLKWDVGAERGLQCCSGTLWYGNATVIGTASPRSSGEK